MYCLDTNICIAIVNQVPLVLQEFNAKFAQCYLSSIVLAELYKGVYCSQRLEQNLATLNQLLGSIDSVDFDDRAAQEFGKIQAELRQKGKPTGEIDALVTAVARSRGDVLVTHNQRHFIHIPTLQLEDWLEVK